MNINRQCILAFLLGLNISCVVTVDGFSQIRNVDGQQKKGKKNIPVVPKSINKSVIDSTVFYEYHPEDSTLNVYRSAEVIAEFVGGSKAFSKFVSDSTRYPLDERERGISGEVIVSFIIERDGSLSNIKIRKGVSPGLDEEAVRLFKSMPKFSPAMQDGRRVRFHYLVPLNYGLKY